MRKPLRKQKPFPLMSPSPSIFNLDWDQILTLDHVQLELTCEMKWNAQALARPVAPSLLTAHQDSEPNAIAQSKMNILKSGT